MPTLIATKAHTYDNRTIQAGEEYEAAEPFATTLVSLGRATRKGESTKVQPTTAKPKAKAEPEAEVEADEPKPKPKAKAENTGYSTRRLKAKDD